MRKSGAFTGRKAISVSAGNSKQGHWFFRVARGSVIADELDGECPATKDKIAWEQGSVETMVADKVCGLNIVSTAARPPERWPAALMPRQARGLSLLCERPPRTGRLRRTPRPMPRGN